MGVRFIRNYLISMGRPFIYQCQKQILEFYRIWFVSISMAAAAAAATATRTCST